MKNCKNCKQEILYTIPGLRSFCSSECKRQYRKNYSKKYKQKIRNDNSIIFKDIFVHKNYGYSDMDSSKMPIATNDKQKENLSTKRGSGTFESYGGKEWYKLAKNECSNFSVREAGGYCVTLINPVKSFKSPCSKCELGIALMKGKGRL